MKDTGQAKVTWQTMDPSTSGVSRDTRLQAHWSCLVPTSLGDQMIPPREDWTHASLTFVDGGLLAGERVDDRFRGALEIDTLSVVLFDQNDDEIARRSLLGRSLGSAFDWLNERVKGELVFPTLDIPPHPVRTDDAPVQPVRAELSALAAWFSNAHQICIAIRKEDPRANAIRVWPHHFDMATVIALDPAEPGGEKRTVTVGFSPGDQYYEEPYFYSTCWPYPSARQLVPFEGAGFWHTEGWIGGILLGKELPADDQAKATLGFVRNAARALEEALG